jgi:hypothetical protein
LTNSCHNFIFLRTAKVQHFNETTKIFLPNFYKNSKIFSNCFAGL